MSKRGGRTGRSILALAATAVLTASTGCMVEDDGGGFPDDSMEINGTVVPIASADVWYFADERYVRFTDTFGDYVEFTFVGQGDPLVTADELPYGDWSGFDAELVEVYVYLVSGSTSATYTGVSPYHGWLRVDGSPPDVLTLDSAFSFADGPIEGFQIAYAGPYGYGPD